MIFFDFDKKIYFYFPNLKWWKLSIDEKSCLFAYSKKNITQTHYMTMWFRSCFYEMKNSFSNTDSPPYFTFQEFFVLLKWGFQGFFQEKNFSKFLDFIFTWKSWVFKTWSKDLQIFFSFLCVCFSVDEKLWKEELKPLEKVEHSVCFIWILD